VEKLPPQRSRLHHETTTKLDKGNGKRERDVGEGKKGKILSGKKEKSTNDYSNSGRYCVGQTWQVPGPDPTGDPDEVRRRGCLEGYLHGSP